MAYSTKVIDHYTNPRNVGSFAKDEQNVGTGVVGAPERMAAGGAKPGGRLPSVRICNPDGTTPETTLQVCVPAPPLGNMGSVRLLPALVSLS